MKLTIRKGTQEIGGSCVEISTLGSRILIDYGTPLKPDSKQEPIGDLQIDAILLSHSHQDHYGEIPEVDPSVPVYCGKLTRALIDSVRIFTGRETLCNDFNYFESWKPFTIGDFRVTPYLVDHSSPDAYAFLIEAEGKKIFYSGDFRASGRKSKLFYSLIKRPELLDIDYMLLEGTMICRENGEFQTESSVEQAFYSSLLKSDNLSFLISSSQNIDRIVSAYRAAVRAGRLFVVDFYTAWIMEKMKLVSSSIPNIDWKEVCILKSYGGSQYQKIKNKSGQFPGFLNKVFSQMGVIDIDQIIKNPSRYLVKVSPWIIDKITKKYENLQADCFYSQWLGYQKIEYSTAENVALYQRLSDACNVVYAHTSGHADLKKLQQFARELVPRNLIPIHTENGKLYTDYFDHVMVLEDCEKLEF